jgi:Peptidase family M20/M25/M40
VSLADAWESFVADLEAWKLSSETIRKYKALKSRMTTFATDKGLSLLADFKVDTLSRFRLTWKDGARTSAKTLERLRAFFRFAHDLGDEIQNEAQEIAKQTGTEITLKTVEHDPPAVADPGLQTKIEAAAAGLGLKTMRLPSGAGHDAQMIAKVAPIGMIFVPSVDGISHSPREFTRWDDCANGANVLLHSILLIDSSSE